MRKRQSSKKWYNSKKQIERLMIARNGINSDKYNKILVKQGGKCAICRQTPIKKLFIDHCHKSKKVRGLLCHHCNTGLGMFKDSIRTIINANKYLTKHAQKEKSSKTK